jgi:hypothetical protein
MPRRRNMTKLNHTYFRSIDSEQKAYWLGFLLADGGINDKVKRGALQLSVHLGGEDVLHLERLRLALEIENPICHAAEGDIRLSASSDILCGDLIGLGCTPRKSFTARLPSIDDALQRHMLRGYFDGDGSACISGGRLFVSFIGTHALLSQIKLLLGVSKKLIPRRGCSHLNLNRLAHLRSAHAFMYEGATVALERKKLVYERGLVRPDIKRECVRCRTPFLISVGRGTANKRYCSLRCRRSR